MRNDGNQLKAGFGPRSTGLRRWLDWPWQARWGMLLAYAGMLAWVSLAPAEKFSGIPVLFPQQDKVVHFLLYGALVWLTRWAMAAHWMVRPAFLVVVAGAIGYGSLMEVLQGVLVNYHRHFEFSDIVANSLGALCFWLIPHWMFVSSSVPRPAAASPNDPSGGIASSQWCEVLVPPFSSRPATPSTHLCMFVSIILPVRNEAATIREVLTAVLRQDYSRELIEVVVADGMSEDGTREIVRELAETDSRLRMVDNPKQITPAGLNVAIRAARGEVLVRVDGHGVLPPNYVCECVAYLKSEDKSQESDDRFPPSALGPLHSGLLAVGGAWDSVGRGRMAEAIAVAMSSKFGVGNSPYRLREADRLPIQTDTLAFWAIYRRTFEHVGLFREKFVCHEDYEFNHRLRSAGGRIMLLPWLRAKYYVRSTLRALAWQYWRYGNWKGRFVRSQPGSLKVRHLIPPLFVAALALCGLAAGLGTAGQIALGALLVLYVGFLIVASVGLAFRSPTVQMTSESLGAIGLVLRLTVIFATLHLCWGAGVWLGLLRGKVAGQPPRLDA